MSQRNVFCEIMRTLSQHSGWLLLSEAADSQPSAQQQFRVGEDQLILWSSGCPGAAYDNAEPDPEQGCVRILSR